MLGAALPLSPVATRTPTPPGFLDLIRAPNLVSVRTSSGDQQLRRTPGSIGQWDGTGLSVRTVNGSRNSLHVELAAPGAAVLRIGLRWHGRLGTTRLLVGDAWERGYGDFEWRGFVPDRVMPWYVMASDGVRTNGYGVRTGANAFCFVAGGSCGRHPLGRRAKRRHRLATRRPHPRRLRRDRAGRAASASPPLPPSTPSAGRCARNPGFRRRRCMAATTGTGCTGRTVRATVTADAEHIVDLSPTGGNRPFVVIDDGWQPGRGADKAGAGTWDHGNDKFPDLPGLVAKIERIGGKAGIWIRPLKHQPTHRTAGASRATARCSTRLCRRCTKKSPRISDGCASGG